VPYREFRRACPLWATYTKVTSPWRQELGYTAPMRAEFPSAEKNELLRRLAKDPRSKKLHQERPKPPSEPPSRFKRVASRGNDWGLTRTMPRYRIERDTSLGGKATKWSVRADTSTDDFFIAKFGNKNGRVEVMTELFNNQLGEALGFTMAHSGVARLDEHLYFLTRNFRRNEALVHGSLLIVEIFSAKEDVDHIGHDFEQSFYTVTFMQEVIQHYCGKSACSVFEKFIEMLVFDALIGSMDRHAMNWGVLRSEFVDEDGKQGMRLAPIFDSARALLWDLPEGRLLKLDADPDALWQYVSSSKPCIGPEPDHPKVNNCNHFEFFESLLRIYPHPTSTAYAKICVDVCGIARRLLAQFPFNRAFSPLRKRLILKVLALRADGLRRIFEEGGARDVGNEVFHTTANA